MASKRKIQIETTVDATGARKGFDEVKTGASSMAQSVAQSGQRAGKGIEAIGTGGDAAASKVDRATRSIISSLERATAQAKTGERGTANFFETLATQRGADPTAIKPYLDGLRQAEIAQQAASGSLNKMGVSAGQTKAALSQLPAQFTDIVTSLQGGQKPLTVLLQQGGQIKDSFGGAGNAARALGGYVLGLVNPVTVAAAAAAGLGLAFFKGRAEQEAFTKTVLTTGGAAGVTADQLSSMSLALKDLGAGTRGRAAEVLNQLAQDSSVGAANLQRFTAAALRLEQVGGPAADATARAFSDLAKSPLDAALKLNDATNFLTRSVYDQIKSLDDQGRAVEAAAVAQSAYAEALETRTPKMLENLGFLEQAWISIKKASKGAWDEFLGIGRADTDGQKLASLRNQLTALEGGAGTGTQLNPQAQKAQSAAIEAKKAQLRVQIAAGEASVTAERALSAEQKESNEELKKRAQYDKDGLQYLTRRQQLEREVTKARNEGAAAGASPAEIAKRVAAIREKFDPGVGTATAESGVNDAKRQLSLLTSAFANAESILESQRSAGLISEGVYYDTKRALIEADRNAQTSALSAESAGIAKKNQSDKLTTAERIANGDKIKDNAAKILEINAKAATSTAVSGAQQTSALNGISRAYEQAKQSAEDYLSTLQKSQQRELDLFGAGNQAQQDAGGRNQISDRYQQERQRIQNDRSLTRIQQGGSLTSDQAQQFDDLLALNRKYEGDALGSYTEYTAKRKALEGDWQQGASRAFANYIDDAQNVSKQTEQAFSSAFQGLEDAIVRFVTTGKLSFSDFAKSAIADLTRIFIKQQLVQAAKTAASFFGFAKGGAFEGGREVTRFAAGGVFDTPTQFTYGGGKQGELGEAGPEGVLPLARGVGGKLGVIAHDGGGKATTVNFAPTYQIDGTADQARSISQMQQIASKSQKDLIDLLRAKAVI